MDVLALARKNLRLLAQQSESELQEALPASLLNWLALLSLKEPEMVADTASEKEQRHPTPVPPEARDMVVTRGEGQSKLQKDDSRCGPPDCRRNEGTGEATAHGRRVTLCWDDEFSSPRAGDARRRAAHDSQTKAERGTPLARDLVDVLVVETVGVVPDAFQTNKGERRGEKEPKGEPPEKKPAVENPAGSTQTMRLMQYTDKKKHKRTVWVPQSITDDDLRDYCWDGYISCWCGRWWHSQYVTLKQPQECNGCACECYPSFFYRTEEELERHNREKQLGLLSHVITEYKFDDQH